MNKRFIVLALVVAATALGASTTSSATGHSVAPPDTYVAAWDAVGTQAFTAAALSPGRRPHDLRLRGDCGLRLGDRGQGRVRALRGRRRRTGRYFSRGGGGRGGPHAFSFTTYRLRRRRSSIRRTQHRWPRSPTARRRPTASPSVTGIANLLIAVRAGDGFRAPVTYTVAEPADPGRLDPDGPDAADRHLPRADAAVQPRICRPVQARRPSGARQQDGGRATTTRSRRSARARARRGRPSRPWQPASGRRRPVQQAHGSFRKFVLDHQLDVVDASRFMAMISVTYADALIACFDAKYHYAFWRPITAIRAGDTDGNKATVGDPAWSPLLPATPNHPEYPSAHSCVTPAGGRVIADFLGTNEIDYTVPSLTGLGDRHFAVPKDLEEEVGNARIWGGIHYPLSGRGWHRDRQADGAPGAHAPLPEVEPVTPTGTADRLDRSAVPRSLLPATSRSRSTRTRR